MTTELDRREAAEQFNKVPSVLVNRSIVACDGHVVRLLFGDATTDSNFQPRVAVGMSIRDAAALLDGLGKSLEEQRAMAMQAEGQVN